MTASKNPMEGVKQTLKACLEAPLLKGVCSKHVIKVKRLRNVYGNQILEKNAQADCSVLLTSYRTSTENSDLPLSKWRDGLKLAAIDELSTEKVRICVKNRGSTAFDEYILL